MTRQHTPARTKKSADFLGNGEGVLNYDERRCVYRSISTEMLPKTHPSFCVVCSILVIEKVGSETPPGVCHLYHKCDTAPTAPAIVRPDVPFLHCSRDP